MSEASGKYMDEYEEKNSSHRPRWPSPAYPGLVGNILPEFLSFSGCPFSEPPSTPQQPFPTLKETYDYLRDFAEPFIEKGSIRLNTEVVRIDELADAKGWDVAIRDWNFG
ncbi:hypothetical protein D9757_012371 [Collybiopsis confluens]|uniref:Uncharacterized protein n=1 Tax=Collybiopsis confluens TaxID=2823264 RepID=A0A8H5LHR1_9AGAR|nr:hypothetical protein D9757_012371 [Collybiopsis confluens]